MNNDAARIEHVRQWYGDDACKGFIQSIRRGGNFARALRRSIDREMREAKRLPPK